MQKHIMNLSHVPASHQALLLFMPTYSWCLSSAWNNVWHYSSHCNWSTAPLNLALLAFAEMAVGSETLSNVISQDVVNKSFRASFQNLLLCFLPTHTRLASYSSQRTWPFVEFTPNIHQRKKSHHFSYIFRWWHLISTSSRPVPLPFWWITSYL